MSEAVTISQERLAQLFTAWQPAYEIEKIEAVTGDASLRRYFRIYYRSGTSGLHSYTVVAMVFDSLKPAEVGDPVSSSESYQTLSGVFAACEVAVPQLFGETLDGRVLFLEDLADVSLSSLVRPGEVEDEVLNYFYDAVRQLLLLQEIDNTVFPYSRAFSEDIYVREMKEFSEYYLGLERAERCRANSFYIFLARELSTYPQVLVHRDFHASNIHVDPALRIRVIDFQDALWGNRCYDIASLLNDRDMDSALGEQNLRLVWRFFAEQSGVIGKEEAESLQKQYLLCLLQRDLKVVGRFSKLSRERGLKHYEKWIPGTLRRIGRNLNHLAKEAGAVPYRDFLAALAGESQEVANGAQLEVKF
ncbi:MAG: phosphotransferase [bacterium]|nr:phosphotransferase [bacterium]